MRPLSDVLRLGACSESIAWADGYGSAWSTALAACPERDWLTWLYGRLLARGHVRRGAAGDRRVPVRAGCHLIPAGEGRPARDRDG